MTTRKEMYEEVLEMIGEFGAEVEHISAEGLSRGTKKSELEKLRDALRNATEKEVEVETSDKPNVNDMSRKEKEEYFKKLGIEGKIEREHETKSKNVVADEDIDESRGKKLRKEYKVR